MSTPNEMRKMIGRMRGKNAVTEDTKKDLSVRDTLKITRSLNEVVEPEEDNKDDANLETPQDQTNEEKKLENYFSSRGENTTFVFGDLKINKKRVYWSFVVNGKLRVVFKVVLNNRDKSGVVYGYKEGVDPNDVDELVEKIQDYYRGFEEYWLKELNNV